MRSALAQSLNTVAVRLSIETGRQPIADLAARMGVKTPLRVTRSLALGSSEVTVLDQATAYAVFANGGYRAEPHGIIDVRTSGGDILYDYNSLPHPKQRVLKESTVLGMTDMLNAVVETGTARRARLPGIHVAGKTGTTNAYKDAWFVGFTGNYSTAVWLGNDDYESTNRLTGGLLPAETWAKYMRVAMAYEVPKPLPGLAPPVDTGEVPVATAGDAPVPLDPGASGRLEPGTAAALGRLSERFSAATSAGAAAVPGRQAALGQGAIGQ